MSRAVTLGLLLAVVVALALRCPQLDERPMHNDEAVNAIKFRTLLETGAYRYDPNEFHGPTLSYLTLALAKFTSAPGFVDFTEARFRVLTIVFGVGLILLLPLVADGLGRWATVVAALLTAISPAMVFYSRYYIHEMLLVFFTFLALAAGWRYTQNRKISWALLAGAAVGLMQATKETFVLTLAAAVAALVLNTLWIRKVAAPSGSPPCKLCPKHLLAALGVWMVVALILFSSFFTNAAGPLDAVRTYMPWLHRNAGASPHIHGWSFYLERLAFFHTKGGPVWSEGLILGLAIVGIFAVFARKGLQGANADFIRFIAFYTIILTGIYSVLAYKTPWCLLNFWHGMILLAGVGAVALVRWPRREWMQVSVAAMLLIGADQLAKQAWRAGVTFAADRQNPYVYAQTSPDILNLVDQVNALSKVSPDGHEMLVKVLAPDSDFWPLPWYFRGLDRVGWWAEMPTDPLAPVMVVSTQFHTALDVDKTHVMVGFFQLRPQTFFELYVRSDLWHAYLESVKSRQP
ncbi:MAG: hypothetical protein JWR26_3717 [Pedosphaera sp.]|nr:hypothetical protein [Pedosphaera sp.]